MRQITLVELRQLALGSKEAIWEEARKVGRDVKIYLHWSAGHYDQFFDDYHANIAEDGSLYVSVDDFSTVLAHTWQRNTGAIGISIACCYNATTSNLGAEPPTVAQIEALARVVCILAEALDLTIDKERVMTHAEAADLDGYGPASTCERWDLWFFADVPKGEGGNVLRGKANWYKENGVDV